MSVRRNRYHLLDARTQESLRASQKDVIWGLAIEEAVRRNGVDDA